MNTEGQRLRCPFTADKAGSYFRIGKLHIHPTPDPSTEFGEGRQIPPLPACVGEGARG